MEKDNPKTKSIALQLTALSAVLLLLVTTISTVLAADTDNYSLVERSSALQDVSIKQVIKLDRNDIYQKATGGQRLEFDIDGKQVSFALQERNLLAEDFKVIGPDGKEDAIKTMAIKNIHVYLGRDLTNAQYASVTISRGSVDFSIDLDGKTYSIAPYDGTGASGFYAVYTSEERSIQPSTRSDGLVLNEPNLGELEIASERQNGSSEQTAIQDLEMTSDDSSDMIVMSSYSNEDTYIYGSLYVACDSNFQATYGSSWSSVAFTTQAYVALRYETQLGICLNLVAIQGLPSGNCTSTDGPTLWGQFKDWTKQNVNRWDRDVAHLFTTKTLDNGVTDVSYETGAALDKFSGSSYDGFACSVSRHVWVLEQNAWYMGHDIGHLLNADHDFSQWIGGKGTWCYPNYAPSDMVFSENNKQRIVSWAQEAFSYQRLMNVGPSATDSNGIQASYTSVKTDSVAEVNREAVVRYCLKNTGSVSKTVMAFTAVKNSYGSYQNFSFQSLTIGPQQTITYQTWFYPQLGGEWTIYPAYIYSEQTKSFDSVAVHPTIYYKLSLSQEKSTSSDMTMFCRWGVYSTVRYPGPGQTIMADFSLFNTHAGTGLTTYNSIFVKARDPNDAGKDFGGVNNPSLTQKGTYGVVGGGYHGVAFKTIDVTGVWKIAPCYQTSGGVGGPWMAPLYIDVGIVKLDWSSLYYNNPNIHNQNIGTKLIMQLPTADGHNATLTVGFLIENFQENIVPYETPGIQIKLAHAYLDNDNSDDWDGHNGLIDIKLYATRVYDEGMGIYGSNNGAPYGTQTAFDNSMANFMPSEQGFPGAHGTNCEYYSLLYESNPDVTPAGEAAAMEVISFVLLEALGLANPYAAFAVGAAGVVANLHDMLNPDPGDYSNQLYGSSSPSWAHWYTTPMPEEIMNDEDDVTSSYNFVSLCANNTNDEYVFKMWAEVTYAYAEEYYPIGCNRATHIDTETTQPIYLVIDA